MNSIYITKTITTLTTWENKQQNQRIEHESDSQTFYFWDDGRISAAFYQDDAADLLKKCDALISAGFNEMDLAGKDFIPNNAFLSIVLSQFLHVPKVDTIHNNSNHN
jgi:hypothetical protein